MNRARPVLESCHGCLAWGWLLRGMCRACHGFAARHGEGTCSGCARHTALKDAYCRLCQCQAAAQVKETRKSPFTAVSTRPVLANLTAQQLFFANMQKRWSRANPHGRYRDRLRASLSAEPQPASWKPIAVQWIQPSLFEARRSFTGRTRATNEDSVLVLANHTADRLAGAYGWTQGTRDRVRWGLAVVLAGHIDGEKICYTQLVPALRPNLSAPRVIDVLREMDLFVDDRAPAFEASMDRNLTGLPRGIRRDVEGWQRHLHHGGPRTAPRSPATARLYLLRVMPALTVWAVNHEHLREVTREDVRESLHPLQGQKRQSVAGALRSLFGWAKRNGTIFANPTARLRIGHRMGRVVMPLPENDIDRAVAAAITPAQRLILALAAIHAARNRAIREFGLDDIDLGNRRIVLAGHTRPLDALTASLLTAWLRHRREQWPHTANPYVLIHGRTAMTSEPVGKFWVRDFLRGQQATLERLRIHRHLDEALTHGPDALHLAAVFGLSDTTAIHYAESARAILRPEPSG